MPSFDVVTLTVHREGQDITVELSGQGRIREALDENGNPVELTDQERKEVYARYAVGEDMTGR